MELLVRALTARLRRSIALRNILGGAALSQVTGGAHDYAGHGREDQEFDGTFSKLPVLRQSCPNSQAADKAIAETADMWVFAAPGRG